MLWLTAGCSGFPREMYCTGNSDDEKADDDGGNGHPLGVPPETLGSFDVPIVVAVQRHDGEDKSHDVDGVRGAKTGDDGEPQVVLGHGHVLLGLVILSVGLGTAVQSPLEVRAGAVLRHGRGRRGAPSARSGTLAARSWRGSEKPAARGSRET